tara:strand:- start:1198 stop:1629 length:432 start_codon:yes stop_codon:yes gene_type:complete
MRRRKAASKRKSYRRRRMSGIGKVGGAATSVLYTVAGAAAAQLVGKVLPAGINAKITAAVPVAVGLFLPKFVKGPAGQGLAAGMIAVGGLKLMQSFGVLNGIGAMSNDADYKAPMIAAYYNREGLVDKSYMTPSIAGLDEEGC